MCADPRRRLYDAIHIHHVVAQVTLGGAQIAHVGWGVYAVIGGALVAMVSLYRARGRVAHPEGIKLQPLR